MSPSIRIIHLPSTLVLAAYWEDVFKWEEADEEADVIPHIEEAWHPEWQEMLDEAMPPSTIRVGFLVELLSDYLACGTSEIIEALYRRGLIDETGAKAIQEYMESVEE